MENILEVKNVYKKYGNKQVINDISFSVKKGEIMGFLGPNGAGKTTIIKMIMGLVKITDGTISICGFDVVKNFEKAAQNFGGIIEEPAMYSELTALDNLKIFSKLYTNISEERIKNIIKQVKLDGRENEPIRNYSLGMKQRLGLAQALIHMPKLLILDEPTNGLDPQGIIELREILKLYAKQGVSVLVSSHILSEMEMLCDRVCIIDKGKLIEIKDLKNKNKMDIKLVMYNIETSDNNKALNIIKEKNTECTIKNNKINLIATKEEISEINKTLVEFGINIYEISIENKKLEEIYLEATKEKKVGAK